MNDFEIISELVCKKYENYVYQELLNKLTKLKSVTIKHIEYENFDNLYYYVSNFIENELVIFKNKNKYDELVEARLKNNISNLAETKFIEHLLNKVIKAKENESLTINEQLKIELENAIIYAKYMYLNLCKQIDLTKENLSGL